MTPLDLQSKFPSELETLTKLFTSGGVDTVRPRLERLNYIFKIAEEKWHQNLNRLNKQKIKFLLLAEAPPWSDGGEVRYFYNTFNSKWHERIWHTFFPNEPKPDIETGLSKLATVGFLLVDTLPFAMKYDSSIRNKPFYKQLVKDCISFWTKKITNSKINWGNRVKVGLAFKLNGLAIIEALPAGLTIANEQKIEFDERLIAADGTGYTNSNKLRSIFGL